MTFSPGDRVRLTRAQFRAERRLSTFSVDELYDLICGVEIVTLVRDDCVELRTLRHDRATSKIKLWTGYLEKVFP